MSDVSAAIDRLGTLFFVIGLTALSIAGAVANDRDKILLGPRTGYATIVSFININSDNVICPL